MRIELHFLQNFAPSNLNRDDTGAPKDCEFGGYRRARISSQCLKRAIRQAFIEYRLLGDDTAEQMAARTKRLVEKTAEILAAGGRDAERARELTAFSLASAKLKIADEQKTQYLLYVPMRTISGLAHVIEQHWPLLDEAAKKLDTSADDERKPGKRKDKSKEKSAAKESVPKEVEKAVAELFLDATKTPDLALFGRMIADNPDWNVDAACQVAHAISTNRVSMEFDFYTAVDDLKPRDTAGSDMMGTIAFQSACFYRYACLDVDALRRNLGGADREETARLTRATLGAFVRASALAIPTGKQNSMAAQNRPSYMLAVIRETSAPQSLANAFVKPIRPDDSESLLERSTAALESYFDRTLELWGDADVSAIACGEVDSVSGTRPQRARSFDQWVKDVLDAAVSSGS